MDVLRVLGALGIGAIIAAGISGVVNYYSTKRRSNIEDKDVAIQAIEAAIPGLGEIVQQMRNQVAWLSQENEKCLKVSAEQALKISEQSVEIAGLKVRVADLERTTNGQTA